MRQVKHGTQSIFKLKFYRRFQTTGGMFRLPAGIALYHATCYSRYFWQHTKGPFRSLQVGFGYNTLGYTLQKLRQTKLQQTDTIPENILACDAPLVNMAWNSREWKPSKVCNTPNREIQCDKHNERSSSWKSHDNNNNNNTNNYITTLRVAFTLTA